MIYDVAIIGGGPGGYSAALYCARAGLSTLVLEQFSAGGQMAQTERVDNYPGFPGGIDGFELAERMQAAAESFGAVTQLATVNHAALAAPVKTLDTSDGPIQARAVVIATGADPRLLDVPGEARWSGRGVHYCATCDGGFYRDKTVAVVGGGNTAAEDALYLARLCRKVYLIHRRDTLRATQIYCGQIANTPKIQPIWNSVVTGLNGADVFQGLTVQNVQTGAQTALPCDGVFVSIGRVPATGFLAGAVATDAGGYLLADESTRTNLPGVFAVGDVRTKAVRQVVTAAADGAVAAHYIEEYLR